MYRLMYCLMYRLMYRLMYMYCAHLLVIKDNNMIWQIFFSGFQYLFKSEHFF